MSGEGKTEFILRQLDRCPGKRILIVDSGNGFNAEAIALLRSRNEVIIDFEPGDTVMTGRYHNRRGMIGLAISAMAGLVGIAASGAEAMRAFCSMDNGPSFGQRYGSNPRSTGNGGMGRGAVMRSKRASKRLRNIRKHNKSAHRGSR